MITAPRRRRIRALWMIVPFAFLATLALVPSVRAAALRPLGSLLLARDPIEPADVCVMTEIGEAVELEVSQLYQERMCPRVVVLVEAPTSVDLELARRGVNTRAFLLDIFIHLGVPHDAITVVEAAEGGTADSTRALSQWARANPSRVNAVVSATHARRYRRTLLRAWPDGVPAPRVTYPRAATFRAQDWWTTRRNLRDGIFELQKLLWDVARHPW